MVGITAGNILIADPFLKDPNFMRSVVFICEHDNVGSLGFVMNRRHKKKIGDLLADLEGINFPVYNGGPVQQDTIHFLHQKPDLIKGGIEIIDGIFWGGKFDDVISLMQEKILEPNMIRFYLGYSGWGNGQLEEELKEKSWLISDGNKKLVFHRNDSQVWKDALKQMGGDYSQLINYPIDPQLN